MIPDMDLAVDILKSTLVIVITLLPIINPLGNVPIFMTIARRHPATIQRMARRVALNSWVILLVSMLIGSYVLQMFGISLGIVRVGGGMLVAATGWRLLQAEDDNSVRVAVADQAADISELEVAKRSFFPMSFPLTAGPGAIAASIALGTNAPESGTHYLVTAVVDTLGALVTAAIVWACYRYGTRLLDKLGEIGTMAMMRFVAFILLCIGLEMVWSGWMDLNGIEI